MRVAPPVRFGLPGSNAAGLPVYRAHHRHVPVRRRRRADRAHARLQRGAQARHPGSSLHGPGALRHPGGGHGGVADPDRVHVGMRVHVAGASHARRAHVAAHGVHGQTGVHVSCCGVTLKHRQVILLFVNAA